MTLPWITSFTRKYKGFISSSLPAIYFSFTLKSFKQFRFDSLGRISEGNQWWLSRNSLQRWRCVRVGRKRKDLFLQRHNLLQIWSDQGQILQNYFLTYQILAQICGYILMHVSRLWMHLQICTTMRELATQVTHQTLVNNFWRHFSVTAKKVLLYRSQEASRCRRLPQRHSELGLVRQSWYGRAVGEQAHLLLQGRAVLQVRWVSLLFIHWTSGFH